MIADSKRNFKEFRLVNREDHSQHNADRLYVYYEQQLRLAYENRAKCGCDEKELRELALADIHRLQGILHGFRLMMSIAGLKI